MFQFQPHMAAQNHIKKSVQVALKYRLQLKIALRGMYSCYLHPGECAKDRPVLLFSSSVFGPLGADLLLAVRRLRRRSTNREEHCVYIKSQTSLMDEKEELDNFYAHLASSALSRQSA